MDNLDNLIKQLNKLPKGSLSRNKDFRIRFNLYSIIFKKKIGTIKQALTLPELKPVPIIAGILLIILVAVPGFAYASNTVTRGHILYGVKKGLEAIEVNFAQDETEKIKKDIKMVSRRLSEAEVLSSKPDREKELVDTIDEARENSQKAQQAAESIKDGKDLPKIEKIITKNKQEQENSLTTIAQNVGVKTSEKVLDSVALAIEEVKTTKFQPKIFRKNLKWEEKASTTEEEVKKTENMASTTEEEVKKTENMASTSTKPEFNRGVDYKPESDRNDNYQPNINSFNFRKNEDMEEEETEKNKAGENGEKTKISEENNEKENNNKNAQASLEELIDKINGLKKDIRTEEYDSEDVNNLFVHFNKRIKEAQESIEEESLNRFNDILESTNALSNNAKNFIKPKIEKCGSEEEESGADSKNNKNKSNNKNKKKNR